MPILYTGAQWLTFRHRASCILGQAFHYSPETLFIYLINKYISLSDIWPATSWVHYITSCNTQSSAPEDGQKNCPKLVELTGIINKPFLLHLVGCLYYLYQ